VLELLNQVWGLEECTSKGQLMHSHYYLATKLSEEADDLLIGKSGLFLSRHSPKLADFVPPLWYGR
jgi:hypothetical protein